MSELKTVIIYTSTHHGNTRKLVEELAAKSSIDTIDIIADKNADISGYDRIGVASGIAFGKYYPQMIEYLSSHLPEKKEVFFIHTAGDPREKHNAATKAIAEDRGCKVLGTFCCKGFDTYGPWKIVGGINKNRPNQDDLQAVLTFYQKL